MVGAMCVAGWLAAACLTTEMSHECSGHPESVLMLWITWWAGVKLEGCRRNLVAFKSHVQMKLLVAWIWDVVLTKKSGMAAPEFWTF